MGVVALLLMVRRKQPKLEFFARCDVRGRDGDIATVLPEEFPFKAELRSCLSKAFEDFEVLDICTSEELAKELSAFETAWSIFPLAWHMTDDFDLFQHVVTGVGAAFERRRKASRKQDDILDDACYDGDPLTAGHKAGLKARKTMHHHEDGGSMVRRHSGGEPGEGGDEVEDDDDDESLFEGMGKDVVDAICDEFVGEDLGWGEDKESESEGEEEEDPGPPDSPVVTPPEALLPEEAPPPPPPPPAPPVLPPVGLRSHDISASNRSFCFICDQRIDKGVLRFDYQVASTRKLSDRKRVHHGCVPALPARSREADDAFLRRSAEAPGVPPEVQALLEKLCDEMRPAAASPSAATPQ